MPSQTASKDKKGFTLIEILVVIGAAVLLFAIGSLINVDVVGRNLLISEQDTLVAVLSKARSRAMNNIDHSCHGVSIEATEYIIFHKIACGGAELEDENIPRNEKIEIDGLNEVVFLQLTGNWEDPEPAPDNEITLDDPNDAADAKTISIEEGGLINW